MADCGHALCLPYDVCQFGPRRLRTQAERDADGTTWHPGGVVKGDPVRVELHPDECVLVIREGVGVMCVRADHRHDPAAILPATMLQRIEFDTAPELDAPEPAPRRRWWHRLTRRNP